MVGKSSDHPDEIRVYALDRIHEMKVTDEPYTMPKDFDGKVYFANYYGIFKGEKEQRDKKVKCNLTAIIPLTESIN